MTFSANLKDKKVVIIDDTSDWCFIMKSFLRKEGCSVISYMNHQDYIDELNEKGADACPDCLIIDFYLRGVEAPQVIREVKKVCEKTLILSVSSDFLDGVNGLKSKHMIEALNAGAHRVIPKDPNEIIDVMTSHLEVRKTLTT